MRLCITERIAAGNRAFVPARTDVPHGITVIDDMAATMIQAAADFEETGRRRDAGELNAEVQMDSARARLGEDRLWRAPPRHRPERESDAHRRRRLHPLCRRLAGPHADRAPHAVVRAKQDGSTGRCTSLPSSPRSGAARAASRQVTPRPTGGPGSTRCRGKHRTDRTPPRRPHRRNRERPHGSEPHLGGSTDATVSVRTDRTTTSANARTEPEPHLGEGIGDPDDRPQLCPRKIPLPGPSGRSRKYQRASRAAHASQNGMTNGNIREITVPRPAVGS